MKIIYGTGNKEKIKQMQKIININNFDVQLLNLKDINFTDEIVEDGKNFEENSRIKANAIRSFCNENGYEDYIIITDDAGLRVDCLNGAPGILSARYAGDHAPQEIVLNKLLGNMSEYTNMEDRTASFVCVLTASLPDGTYIVSRGETKGKVALSVGKYGGLTYEPVFIPNGFNKPIGEMSIDEFAKVKNHRDVAMIDILSKLNRKQELDKKER